ncbi:MAG: PorT family protein [Salinivirgaceae bacterium]|nr:PorT family protein [Salinivirgaceae bacterium]
MQKFKILIILIFLSTFSYAQFSVGVRQGYGMHGLAVLPGVLTQMQVSYWRPNTGLVVTYVNAQNSGLQFELNYAQKGWKEIDDTVPGSYYTKTISYLELPVLSHFEIGSGAVRPTITAGIYVAYKLSETSDSANFSHIFELNKKYDHYSQKIKDLDFGIKVGLGLRYNINNKLAVFIEGRYDIDVAGGRDIFIDRPNDIEASRLKEMSASIGVVWHLIPQKKNDNSGGYVPKEDLYDN